MSPTAGEDLPAIRRFAITRGAGAADDDHPRQPRVSRAIARGGQRRLQIVAHPTGNPRPNHAGRRAHAFPVGRSNTPAMPIPMAPGRGNRCAIPRNKPSSPAVSNNLRLAGCSPSSRPRQRPAASARIDTLRVAPQSMPRTGGFSCDGEGCLTEAGDVISVMAGHGDYQPVPAMSNP